MTRVISIFLLGALLYVQTPIRQVLKIYVLVEHYFEHKNLDTNTTLLDFLFVHYGSDKQQPDHGRDMQLPFKQYHPTSLVFTFPLNTFIKITSNDIFANSGSLSGYRSPYHEAESLARIWQPPKGIIII